MIGLLPYQKEAVRQILSNNRSLVISQFMGDGAGIVCVAAAIQAPSISHLVFIVPKVLHWSTWNMIGDLHTDDTSLNIEMWTPQYMLKHTSVLYPRTVVCSPWADGFRNPKGVQWAAVRSAHAIADKSIIRWHRQNMTPTHRVAMGLTGWVPITMIDQETAGKEWDARDTRN